MAQATVFSKICSSSLHRNGISTSYKLWIPCFQQFSTSVEVSSDETEKVKKVEISGKRLYVGGLPNEISASELKTHFKQYGQITNLKLKRQKNDKPNYGFVTYGTDAEADACLAEASHLILNQQVEVKIALNQVKKAVADKDIVQADSTEGTKRDREATKLAKLQGKRIFVSNLTKLVGQRELRDYFSKYGKVKYLRVHRADRFKPNFAFVEYATKEQANDCLAEQSHLITCLNSLTVRPAGLAKGEREADSETTQTSAEASTEFSVETKNQGNKIYIKNIPAMVSKDDLVSYFGEWGNVLGCNVVRFKGDPKRSYGFVTFESEEQADACVAGKPHRIVCPSKLYVRLANEDQGDRDSTDSTPTDATAETKPDSAVETKTESAAETKPEPAETKLESAEIQPDSAEIQPESAAVASPPTESAHKEAESADKDKEPANKKEDKDEDPPSAGPPQQTTSERDSSPSDVTEEPKVEPSTKKSMAMSSTASSPASPEENIVETLVGEIKDEKDKKSIKLDLLKQMLQIKNETTEVMEKGRSERPTSSARNLFSTFGDSRRREENRSFKPFKDEKRLGFFQRSPKGAPITEPPPPAEGSALYYFEQYQSENFEKMMDVPSITNAYEEAIDLTKQGKMFEFPINNEQGLEEESNVPFYKHVFLESKLNEGNWCAKQGPVRNFMVAVCSALSLNPYLKVAEKEEHINWFRDYFIEKREMLQQLGINNVVPAT